MMHCKKCNKPMAEADTSSRAKNNRVYQTGTCKACNRNKPFEPIEVVFFNGCTGLTHAFEVVENGQVSEESLCGFSIDDCDDLATTPGPHMRECAICERVRVGSFLGRSDDDNASGNSDGEAYS